MDTPAFLYVLECIQTTLTVCAIILIAATLFFYSSYASTHKIPLRAWHTLLPFSFAAATIFAVFYGSPTVLWCCIPLFLCTFFVPTAIRIFYLHALLCALCAGCMLYTKILLHQAISEFLQEHPHTIHAVITDIAPWHRTPSARVVTFTFSHIDYQPYSGVLRCYVYSTPRVAVGQHVCLYKLQTNRDKVKKPRHLLAYALRETVVGTTFLPYLKARVLRPSIPWRYHTWWYTWRATVYDKIEKMLAPEAFTYISALFFGNKNRPDYHRAKRLFSTWGITHYLARSGLHVALIIFLWSLFLLLLPLPPSGKQLILLLLLWLYAQLSWSSISFLRAVWLWLLYAGALMSSRAAQPLYLLSIICICIALLQPAYILCIDFQLSFFLTGVLMAFGAHKKQEFLLSSCAIKSK